MVPFGDVGLVWKYVVLESIWNLAHGIASWQCIPRSAFLEAMPEPQCLTLGPSGPIVCGRLC